MNQVREEVEPGDAEGERLFERAQAAQWRAAELDFTRVEGGAAGAWRRHLLSPIYYADQAALSTCGQLIAQVPSLAARGCLAQQAVDEARHVEVIGRYLAPLGGPERLGPHMKSLLQALLGTPHGEERLVGVHLVLEGYAMDACQAILATTGDELLRRIAERVARDEARHMELTTLLLRRLLAAATPKRRREVERALAGYAADLAASTRWRGGEGAPEGAEAKLTGEEARQRLAVRAVQVGL
jgi:hypothetical protein